MGVYLARADGTTQFDLLNVSNPYMPQIVDSFSILESADRSAIAIHPSGNYIYAASGNTWHIFKIRDTLPPELSIEKSLPSAIITPVKTENITPAATIIIISIFIASIVLFYWVWKHKIKR